MQQRLLHIAVLLLLLILHVHKVVYYPSSVVVLVAAATMIETTTTNDNNKYNDKIHTNDDTRLYHQPLKKSYLRRQSNDHQYDPFIGSNAMIHTSHRKTTTNNISITSNEDIPIHEDIVGGMSVSSTKKRYPFFGFTQSGPLCGVTLIHTDIAITVGHCAGIFIPNGIYFGGIQLNGQDAIEDISVLQELRHPLYNKNTYENDIMLLKLQRTSNSTSASKTTFIPGSAKLDTSSVSPIKNMNRNRYIPRNNVTVTTIGLGTTTENGVLANILQQVTIRVIPNDVCYNMYNNRYQQSIWIPSNGKNVTISNSMICASSPGKDACQGDSGGPLLMRYTNTQTQQLEFLLIGMVSWGSGCARTNRPGVYTRISSYMNFIQNGICTLSEYKPSYCT